MMGSVLAWGAGLTIGLGLYLAGAIALGRLLKRAGAEQTQAPPPDGP